MGRGVMTHPGAVATAYRTLNNNLSFCVECDAENDTDGEGNYLDECPECGADMYDQFGDTAREEYEHLVDWIREVFEDAFPSMDKCDRWAHGAGAMDELRCIVANYLCDIYISEYCGMLAISAVPTGDDSYTGNTHGLATHWCEEHAANLLQLFNEYTRLGSMSNGEQVYRRAS